jgi:replicative DNA helicase
MPVDFAQSSRVLSMLPKIDPEDAKMFVEAAVALLPDSPMAQHLVHYQHALAYYERHHAWPDLAYLREEFKKTLKEGVESDPELDYEHDGEVSPCLITDFLRMIEEDTARHVILMAMGEGDFATVAERAQSLGTVKKPVAYSVDDALAAYKKRQDHGGTGILCGVDRIDEVVNGFPYGTMTVVAAPPSMGKSTFAVNTAYHCIKRGFKVCFVTLEVPKENLTYNFIARHAAHRGEMDLTAEPMHKGKLTQEQGEVFERMAAELKPLMEKNLFILDASDFPKFDRAYLNKLWDQIDEALGGLDVIVLDYVNMCRYFRPPKVEINAYVNDIITYFAILSRTFKKGRGLIVFLLAQVNREGQRRLDYKDGEKGADQTILAEFNSLERDAHFIIVLYTSLAMRVAGQVKVQVIKNRTGPVHDQMQPVNANFGQFWFDAGTVKEIFGLDEYSNRWKGTDPAPSARADEAALAEEVEMALDNADQRYEEPVE